MAKLTAKQQRFVEEYLIDLNATQAAIRAGYSERSASATAARLIANDKVATAISEAKAAVSKRNKVTVDRIIQELAYIAFGRLTDVVSWNNQGVNVLDSDELEESAIAAVHSVRFRESKTEFGTTKTVEVKQYDKLAALEKLARHLGFYNTKPPAAPIRIEIVEAIPDFRDDEDPDGDGE